MTRLSEAPTPPEPPSPGPQDPSSRGAGLVLEGGGMRVAYTAGVLDAFLDEDVHLPYVAGVSAGGNAGSDYLAGQRERNYGVFVEFVADPRYAGWKNLLRERSWFGMRFLFETLPDSLLPFDYEAFHRTPALMVSAVTDCDTGRPVYFRHSDHDPRWFVHTVLRASCSLPMLSPPVEIHGRTYLDGGLSDPIPVERAIADGWRRNVVVLTRNAGYHKDAKPLGLATRLALSRHPAIRRLLSERHEIYRAALDRVAALEAAGEAFVLRPVRPLVVDRFERDVDKLDALYRQGYDETMARMPALKSWLAGNPD